MIGFILAALYVTIKDYNNDLINSRRKERIALIVWASIFICFMTINSSYNIANRIYSSISGISHIPSFPIPQEFYPAFTYIAILALGFWRYRYSYSPSITAHNSLENASMMDSLIKNAQEADKELLQSINRVMKNDKLYLTPRLTVGKLAEKVSSQEYLVRNAINRHMDYRNFSEFVNYFRISEAESRLTNSSEPISNIGLDVGYTSLSAFHKAFKDMHAITPKEYRIRQQAVASARIAKALPE